MKLPRRQRGRHQLQAVHGLPRRVLQRRRPDPAGDADGRRVRGDDHDARRERHRHRRARRSRRSPAARPTRSTTRYTRPSPARGARPRTGRSCSAKVAGNVPLYIVHMSAGDALDEVAAARHEGRNVFAETCPQYLYLTLEDHARASPASKAPSGCARTPLRTKDTTRLHGRWHAPGRSVEGPADERAGRRVDRPLPVLHEGPEGARASATSPRSPTASAASSTAWS